MDLQRIYLYIMKLFFFTVTHTVSLQISTHALISALYLISNHPKAKISNKHLS